MVVTITIASYGSYRETIKQIPLLIGSSSPFFYPGLIALNPCSPLTFCICLILAAILHHLQSTLHCPAILGAPAPSQPSEIAPFWRMGGTPSLSPLRVPSGHENKNWLLAKIIPRKADAKDCESEKTKIATKAQETTLKSFVFSDIGLKYQNLQLGTHKSACSSCKYFLFFYLIFKSILHFSHRQLNVVDFLCKEKYRLNACSCYMCGKYSKNIS